MYPKRFGCLEKLHINPIHHYNYYYYYHYYQCDALHAEQGESNKRDTAQQVKATDSTRLAVILMQRRKTLLAGTEPTLTRAPHRQQVIHIFFMPHNVLEVFPSLPTTMVCVCV